MLKGEEWKERRAEITPGFTTNRVRNCNNYKSLSIVLINMFYQIKTVFPVTNKVCTKLVDYIAEQSKIGNKDGIDGKDVSCKFIDVLYIIL